MASPSVAQVVESFGAAYVRQQAQGGGQRAPPCPARMASPAVAEALERLGLPSQLPPLALSFGADWADAMCFWATTGGSLTRGCTLHMDELLCAPGADRRRFLLHLLRWAGLEPTEAVLDAAEVVYASDSQKGHIMSGTRGGDDERCRFLSAEAAMMLSEWLRELSGLEAHVRLANSLLSSPSEY